MMPFVRGNGGVAKREDGRDGIVIVIAGDSVQYMA